MRIIEASLADTPFADAAPVRRWSCGMAGMDAALNGGLAYGCVHEVYAGESGDAAAAAGFTLAIATGMSGGINADRRPLLWLRARRCVEAVGVFQGAGWADLSGAHDGGLMGVVGDTMGLMRAAVDGLRCGALGAVVMESWGAMRELDLTASRRFALAAEQSGVPLFILRVDATPAPSAARTRWQVAAAPSRGLAQAGPGEAPGMATFDVTLLRQRSGPSGLNWRVEWDRERCKFDEGAGDETLSGAVVPAPAHRPAPDRTGGRRAA